MPYLVFSRYNEIIDHLEWVKEYPHLIYNRGQFLSGEPSGEASGEGSGSGSIEGTKQQQEQQHFNIVHEYSNVGREAFMYLLFIIKHYHKLPHRIIFSQTNQVDKSVFNFDNTDFQELVQGITKGTIALKKENDGFAYLVPKCYGFWYGIMNPTAHKLFPSYFKDLIQVDIKNTRFQPFGCFLVEREVIVRRPQSYYITLLETALSSENDPVIGHFFEHAWSQILHSNCSVEMEYFCGLDNLKDKC
jgi:hypothetical protein